MAIHASPRLLVLLFLAHLLAALAVNATPLPLPVRLVIFLPVLVSLTYHSARDALLRLPTSWISLSIGDGTATIITLDGSELTGQVSGSSVATPGFVILRIKPDGKRWSVAHVIFPDALEHDAYRELCVRLRFPSGA
ncbi:MAG: protein YgfX [Gallionella sp.]